MAEIVETNPADAHRDGFAHQQAIRARCVHPSGSFVEFGAEGVEQSVPARSAQRAAVFHERVAVKSRTAALTYGQLDRASSVLAHAILARRGDRAEPVALLVTGIALVRSGMRDD